MKKKFMKIFSDYCAYIRDFWFPVWSVVRGDYEF